MDFIIQSKYCKFIGIEYFRYKDPIRPYNHPSFWIYGFDVHYYKYTRTNFPHSQSKLITIQEPYVGELIFQRCGIYTSNSIASYSKGNKIIGDSRTMDFEQIAAHNIVF